MDDTPMKDVSKAISQPLDEVIKAGQKNRRGRGRGGRGRGGRGRGRGNRSRTRGSNRGRSRFRNNNSRGSFSEARSRTNQRNRDMSNIDAKKWRNDKFRELRKLDSAPRKTQQGFSTSTLRQISTGTQIDVSNLDPEVTSDDVREIFQQLGKVKKAQVQYDESSNSLGTAVVVFVRQVDALKAFQEYNGVKVDGKPMKIAIVRKDAPPEETNSSRLYNPDSSDSGPVRGVRGRGGRERDGRVGRGRGGRSGRGRGRGRGRAAGSDSFVNPLLREVRGGGGGRRDTDKDFGSSSKKSGKRHIFGSALNDALRDKPKLKEIEELDAEMDEYHSK